MPEKSYWTQELRKQQWVKSSGLSSILSFPLFGSGHPLWNLWEQRALRACKQGSWETEPGSCLEQSDSMAQ